MNIKLEQVFQNSMNNRNNKSKDLMGKLRDMTEHIHTKSPDEVISGLIKGLPQGAVGQVPDIVKTHLQQRAFQYGLNKIAQMFIRG